MPLILVVSFRIGQVQGQFDPEYFYYTNDYTEKSFYVGLMDKNNQLHWKLLNDIIPRVDRFTAMSTVVVDLDEFFEVDLTQMDQVFFALLPGASGSIIIDSIEWLRD